MMRLFKLNLKLLVILIINDRINSLLENMKLKQDIAEIKELLKYNNR